MFLVIVGAGDLQLLHFGLFYCVSLCSLVTFQDFVLRLRFFQYGVKLFINFDDFLNLVVHLVQICIIVSQILIRLLRQAGIFLGPRCYFQLVLNVLPRHLQVHFVQLLESVTDFRLIYSELVDQLIFVIAALLMMFTLLILNTDT